MITIKANIEDKAYHYKEWYKKMYKLVGSTFDTTPQFENTLSVGHKIIIDTENPQLPAGMTIPQNASFTLDDLSTKTLEVLSISQTGNIKSIDVGIRSTNSSD
jgi:hypothetical protein